VTHSFPLKVVFITGALSFGGLERVVINLCRNLDSRRFKAVVICLKNRGELANELEEAGIEVICLDANRHRLFKYFNWVRLAKIIHTQRPAVIHTHNTAAFIDAAMAYSIAPGCGFIHTDHNRNFPDSLRYMFAERLASYLSYRIIAVSEENKENLIRYEKISRRKIEIINNGIDQEKFNLTIDVDAAKNNLGVADFDFLIGTVAVLRQEKGLNFFIKAIPMVLEKHPNTGFVIIGDGPLRDELEKIADNVGVRNNLVFLGSRTDVPELLQLFDIFVLPSLWEGLPMSLLEAMAAGKCILASNVGGIPSAIRNGIDGLLIPAQSENKIADNLIKLRENTALRNQYAQSARLRFKENYTVEGMVEKYQKLYLEAFERKFSQKAN
jgi:glycosyltransferase involved in cell wall biosynthesis